VPSGWGSAFWHSLAFADTRVGGLRERAQHYFEAGCPSFPEDYACTHAFKIEIDKKAKDLSARWHRTPVAKRVNYAKLQTHSPWRPAFPEIIAKLADSLAELARSGMEAAEDPFKTEVALGTGLQNAPYLLGGQFLAKVLPQAAAWLSTQSNFISCLYQLQIMYKTQIENKFKKRRLPLEPSAFKARILDAFVKIRLDPLTRGSPKYNAIIYRLSESQVCMIRDQLRSGKYNGDIATLLEQQMQCDAEESGRLYPGRQPDMVDSDEEESQQEDQGGPQSESGVGILFLQYIRLY
jgi:ribonuclease P/MRP protein subunit POP1